MIKQNLQVGTILLLIYKLNVVQKLEFAYINNLNGMVFFFKTHTI